MYLPANLAKKSAYERHSSLLNIRLIESAKGIHPMIAKLSGAIPGFTPPAVVKGINIPLEKPENNAMDIFFNRIKEGML